MELDAEQLRRYSRQVMLPEVGIEGQKKICATSVLCIGVGGLGSPAALYLAAAGVGRLGLVDFDQVDLTNLQRQVLHSTGELGQPKTESARRTLLRLNPAVDLVVHNARLTSRNALELIRPYDIVIDGTDNLATRYLANDACVLLQKPNVYGAVFRFEGQASLFAPHLGGPCYRCLFPEPPPPEAVPSCAAAGVLGVLPGVIGLLQATEALKLAAGLGTPLLNRMLLFDALAMNFRELKVRPDPGCPRCGEHPTLEGLVDYDQLCGLSPAEAPTELRPDQVTVQQLRIALENPALGIRVIDVREPEEFRIAHLPGVMLLPLSQLHQRLPELDPHQAYYIHCKAGARSHQALELLRRNGFTNVKSVHGGINAWSREIDPGVPLY